MIVPTIHLNGTSRERLIEQLCNASDALDAAYMALKQCAPNGRDYYHQGSEALSLAIAEHESRLRRLDAVLSEINELALKISEA